jgi:hypothetical protein
MLTPSFADAQKILHLVMEPVASVAHSPISGTLKL